MALNERFRDSRISNESQNINSQCKIVVYNWAQQSLNSGTPDSTLTETSQLDISSQLLGCEFSKNMGEPAGTFSFRLSNSPGIGSGDWKDIIKRGTWCVIYMSNDGDLTINPTVAPPLSASKKLEEAKKIRCIGWIDRVAVVSSMDSQKGSFDVEYEVSGRDFGVIYEDTSIWHNVFKHERIMLDALNTSGLSIIGEVTIDEAIDKIHDLFFNPKAVPGAKVNDNNSLTDTALQWLMPRQLLIDIGFTLDAVNQKPPFWGSLPGIKKLSKTKAGLSIEKPTEYLSGNAWDNLKRISSPHLHELFTETNESGLPALIFRPIPFGIDNSNYRILGNTITLYKDLPTLTIPALDVIDFNLGEDNHARYNSYLVTVSTNMISTENNVSLLKGSRFPLNIQDSIKRNGFRPMHITVDSIVKNAKRGDGESNPKLLKAFNELMVDYWQNSVFAESGTTNIIGRNDIKVGKAMKFGDKTPYVSTRRYYIEGYTDSFRVDEKGSKSWTQSLQLTRGFEEEDLKARANFGERENEFNQEGEYTPSGSSTGQKNRK